MKIYDKVREALRKVEMATFFRKGNHLNHESEIFKV